MDQSAAFKLGGPADLPTSMKFRNSLRIFLPITEKLRNYGFFFTNYGFFLEIVESEIKSSRRAQKQADRLLRGLERRYICY